MKRDIMFVYFLYTCVAVTLLIMLGLLSLQGFPLNWKNFIIASLSLNIIFLIDVFVRFIRSWND